MKRFLITFISYVLGIGIIAWLFFVILSPQKIHSTHSDEFSKGKTKRMLNKQESTSETENHSSMQSIDSDNIIYLTFDDGPDEATTPQLLKILNNKKVKATFFVTGHGPDNLIKQEYDDGHKIGLHSFTHNYETVYASENNYFNDLQLISDRVANVTGQRSELVRVPGGSSNTISNTYSPGIMNYILPEIIDKGYQYFDWNVSSGDGAIQTSSDQPYNNVTTQLVTHRNNVVLMHDTKQTSIDAVSRIIDFAKQNRYHFELLNKNSFPAHQR